MTIALYAVLFFLSRGVPEPTCSARGTRRRSIRRC